MSETENERCLHSKKASPALAGHTRVTLSETSGIFHGWWIVGVAMLTQLVSNGLLVYSYGLLVIPIGTELGTSRTEMMWGKTGFLLTTVLLSPLLGMLLDRRSICTMMILGSLALGLSFVLISVSQTVVHISLAFAVLPGLAYTLLGILGTNTLVVRWFVVKRARALSLAALGASIGGLLVPYLFQMMIDAWGWRSACFWSGIIATALTLPATALLVHNQPEDIGLYPDGAATLPTSVVVAPPMPVDNLLRTFQFWSIAISVGAVFAANAAIIINIVPFAQQHGIASKQAVLFLPVIAVSALAGKLLFSFIADRVDLKFALLTCMVVQIPPIIAFTQTNDYMTMLACAVIYGAASGGQLPSWAALLARLYGPAHYGYVMGSMLPIISILGAMVVPLIGVLFDHSGNYISSFMFLVAMIVFAAATLLLSRAGGRSPVVLR